ncbi:MAG: 3-isopropylmalate dehydratase [Promethearchaeota archaeon]
MTERPLIIKGKAVLLADTDGNMINSIDTDMIFHNKYLHITDINEMGQYALDNLEGWKDFVKRIETEKWEIVIVGENFGAGSSRQQAVDCFKALGIKAIIGESFGAIYKRNVINSGIPLIQLDKFDVASIDTDDELLLNLKEGKLENQTKKINVPIKPMSQVQMDIYLAGDLFTYGSTIN